MALSKRRGHPCRSIHLETGYPTSPLQADILGAGFCFSLAKSQRRKGRHRGFGAQLSSAGFGQRGRQNAFIFKISRLPHPGAVIFTGYGEFPPGLFGLSNQVISITCLKIIPSVQKIKASRAQNARAAQILLVIRMRLRYIFSFRIKFR